MQEQGFQDEILQFIYDNRRGDYFIELNDFIAKKYIENNDWDFKIIATELLSMRKNNRIKLSNEIFIEKFLKDELPLERVGIVKAIIESKEIDRIESKELEWYNRKLAKQQYEDYPETKRNAKNALHASKRANALALVAIAISIIGWLLEHFVF